MAVKGGEKSRDRAVAGGGQTTKIHVLTDVIGHPFAFKLTAGNAADSPIAPVLLNSPKGARYLLTDKGYDVNSLRKHLRKSANVPVIPGRSNRKRSIRYNERRYKERHLIENAFCRLKDFRRIATRYDKLARNFLSAIALATLIAFWI